jgi:NAD(P)-dependent dehydrogenase (short-subunit alcohol dehydrogenase family)
VPRTASPTSMTGKTVLITGAAHGLGAHTARMLHARGATVALADIDLAAARVLAGELGDRAVAHQADVRDRQALDAVVAQVVAQCGGIDVVVANAGIAPPSHTVLTIDPDDFERCVEIDLLGQWRTIRAALPSVVERRGHVMAVSSIYAFFNGVLAAPYAASKAGLEQLVRALRVELGPHGATAGIAYLGFVQTDLVSAAFSSPQVDTFRRSVPGFLTRPIPVEQGAAAIVEGIEKRSARVSAPRWVAPALATRGVLGPVSDLVLRHRAAAAVRQAEQVRAAEIDGPSNAR